MILRVDGDGCPDISVMEELAKQNGVQMAVYIDSSHVLTCDYAEVIILDTSSQSVDIKLVNSLAKGDIVVTQDYGVAVVALAKGAKVVHPNGREYTDDTIMMMLTDKYVHQKLRKQNIRVKGPKKRNHKNTELLCQTLQILFNS